ncbi:hypothetical protein Tco_1151763 [Tanacetum coccineum]
METIHVKHNELTAMASEHSCLELATNHFNDADSLTEFTSTPSKEDLDNTLRRNLLMCSLIPLHKKTLNNEDMPSSSSIIVEDNEVPPLISSLEEQISPISTDVAAKLVQEDSADFDENTLITPYNSLMFEEAEPY